MHSLPQFGSKMQWTQIANGQFVIALFIIPIVKDIHGCRFKISTLSEIHENTNLVFGIKNILELEGIIHL